MSQKAERPEVAEGQQEGRTRCQVSGQSPHAGQGGRGRSGHGEGRGDLNTPRQGRTGQRQGLHGLLADATWGRTGRRMEAAPGRSCSEPPGGASSLRLPRERHARLHSPGSGRHSGRKRGEEGLFIQGPLGNRAPAGRNGLPGFNTLSAVLPKASLDFPTEVEGPCERPEKTLPCRRLSPINHLWLISCADL